MSLRELRIPSCWNSCTIRTTQRTIPTIKKFFGGHYLGLHLAKAVHRCQSLRTRDQTPVTWLTCIGKGAMEVNYEYLRQLGYGTRHEIGEQSDVTVTELDELDIEIRNVKDVAAAGIT